MDASELSSYSPFGDFVTYLSENIKNTLSRLTMLWNVVAHIICVSDRILHRLLYWDSVGVTQIGCTLCTTTVYAGVHRIYMVDSPHYT